MKMRWALWLAVAIPVVGVAQEDAAYPRAPIHIVVPFAPGGASDLLTRRVGERLAQQTSQPVIVDNKPGGNTIIASEFVARAPADGYTLYSTNTTIVQIPMLYSARYDEARDFVPIVKYATAPLALAVLADSPVKSLKDLVDAVKAKPGKTSYGTAGAGGTQHINSEALKRATGMDSVHVPYKGESPLLTDFLGGRLDWYIATPLTIMPHVRSGKVRLLAVTGNERLPLTPEVPTFPEAGVPDLSVVGWYGLFAPAKTPAPIVEKLSQSLEAIVRSPDMVAYMQESGLVVAGEGTNKFREGLPHFRETFQRMIKENNIRID